MELVPCASLPSDQFNPPRREGGFINGYLSGTRQDFRTGGQAASGAHFLTFPDRCTATRLAFFRFELDRSMTGHYEEVAILNNGIEADFLKGELDVRRIPYVIEPLSDGSLGGLFNVAHGWGKVSVPVECKEIVMEILAGIRDPTGEDTG